mmetsp:Transcript_11110/g.33045  ORF Transcript_11110/g.33045 Transcript_11110/m.33045 type:complete len:149 (-) Transcript_11110:1752-2198(-)
MIAVPAAWTWLSIEYRLCGTGLDDAGRQSSIEVAPRPGRVACRRGVTGADAAAPPARIAARHTSQGTAPPPLLPPARRAAGDSAKAAGAAAAAFWELALRSGCVAARQCRVRSPGGCACNQLAAAPGGVEAVKDASRLAGPHAAPELA